MAAMGREDAAASFDPLRPKLMRVAYRMLGSVADAEDVLQDAFIRWMGADRSEVRASISREGESAAFPFLRSFLFMVSGAFFMVAVARLYLSIACQHVAPSHLAFISNRGPRGHRYRK